MVDRVSPSAALAAAVLLATGGVAAAQTIAPPAASGPMATGAGRDGELDEAARIDAYLADASGSPSIGAPRPSVAEARGSAGALPPMSPDSPWARGVAKPIDGPLPLAGAAGPEQPCDHRLHGEVGAEIGTGGEKGGYGVVTAPIGSRCQAQVTIGVGAQHGRGYGGYGGYGYGRNRTQEALSLGFSTTGAHAQRPPSDLPPEE